MSTNTARIFEIERKLSEIHAFYKDVIDGVLISDYQSIKLAVEEEDCLMEELGKLNERIDGDSDRTENSAPIFQDIA